VYRGLCRLPTIVFRRVINAPISGNTYDKWVAAAQALGTNEIPVCYYLVSTDFQGAHHPLVNDLQIQDYGPVTGGVGAVATSTPFPIPPTTSSSTHLVANGFFALLAAAFGFAITLT